MDVAAHRKAVEQCAKEIQDLKNKIESLRPDNAEVDPDIRKFISLNISPFPLIGQLESQSIQVGEGLSIRHLPFCSIIIY